VQQILLGCSLALFVALQFCEPRTISDWRHRLGYVWNVQMLFKLHSVMQNYTR